MGRTIDAVLLGLLCRMADNGERIARFETDAGLSCTAYFWQKNLFFVETAENDAARISLHSGEIATGKLHMKLTGGGLDEDCRGIGPEHERLDLDRTQDRGIFTDENLPAIIEQALLSWD